MATPRLELLALKLLRRVRSLSALQLTVPLGALAEVGVLSVTVAVQLVGLPTGTVSGAQLTTVLVACFFAGTTQLPAQLGLTSPVTWSVLAPPRLQLLALKLPPPAGTL